MTCTPGAELDRVDYHAHVAIKVGPVGMTLAGRATLVSRDDEAREMVVRGNARDRRGNGSTEATVRLVARDDAGQTTVTVMTDLELSGRMAQFGEGVVTQVSNRIIRQFVNRLGTVITGDGQSTGEHRVAAPASAVAPVGYLQSERITLALTALAGAALGLAIGRWADRLSCPPGRN